MFKLKKTICIIMSVVTASAAVSLSALSASADYMLMGDVNIDGKITLRDATLAQKIEIGLATANSDQKYVGDMDKNGSITVVDAYLIQRLATRDSEVMEGNASAGIPAYCPSRSKRVAFYDALNAERAAQGLSAVVYTDAMLAAGQELCDTWYEEYMDPDNPDPYTYSRYRNYEDQYGRTKMYPTVFTDYGITGFTGGALLDCGYGESKNGKTFFNSMRTDYKKNGEDSTYYGIYHDLLMKPELTALCIGEVELTNSALWIITGF